MTWEKFKFVIVYLYRIIQNLFLNDKAVILSCKFYRKNDNDVDIKFSKFLQALFWSLNYYRTKYLDI